MNRTVGDWSEQTSSSGKRYYYHRISEVSQWEKPEEWKEWERQEEERKKLAAMASAARPGIPAASYQGNPLAQNNYLNHPPPPPPPISSLNLTSVTNHGYTNPYGPGPLATQVSFPVNLTNFAPAHVASPRNLHQHQSAVSTPSSGLHREARENRPERDRARDLQSFRERERSQQKTSPRDRDRERPRETERNNHVQPSTSHYKDSNSHDVPSSSFHDDDRNTTPSRKRLEERPRLSADERPVKTPRLEREREEKTTEMNGGPANHETNGGGDSIPQETGSAGSVPMDIEDERTESNELQELAKFYDPQLAEKTLREMSLEEDHKGLMDMMIDTSKLIFKRRDFIVKFYSSHSCTVVLEARAEATDIRIKYNREMQRMIDQRRQEKKEKPATTSNFLPATTDIHTLPTTTSNFMNLA
ncbi:unnamed protein product, partial [Mesorhabditis spiculigera]